MKNFTETNAFLWRPLTGLTLIDMLMGAAMASLVRLLDESQEPGASSINLGGRRCRTAMKSGPTGRSVLPTAAGSLAQCEPEMAWRPSTNCPTHGQVLECASPLALSVSRSFHSGRGLPHSKTLSRQHLAFSDSGSQGGFKGQGGLP